jgi:hypothetical protein
VEADGKRITEKYCLQLNFTFADYSYPAFGRKNPPKTLISTGVKR